MSEQQKMYMYVHIGKSMKVLFID